MEFCVIDREGQRALVEMDGLRFVASRANNGSAKADGWCNYIAVPAGTATLREALLRAENRKWVRLPSRNKRSSSKYYILSSGESEIHVHSDPDWGLQYTLRIPGHPDYEFCELDRAKASGL